MINGKLVNLIYLKFNKSSGALCVHYLRTFGAQTAHYLRTNLAMRRQPKIISAPMTVATIMNDQ